MFESITNAIKKTWGTAARIDESGVQASADGYGFLGLNGTAHRAANRVEKTLADWGSVMQSADAELLPERSTIIGRTRDLARSNGFAAGALQMHTDNIVGPKGFRLSARPDWRALGKSKEWAVEFATVAESLWKSWAVDPLECDASGLLDFADQTTVHFKGAWLNGDSFALPLWLPDSNRKWSTRMQGIESDRVINPQRGPDTAFLRGGIVIDAIGRNIAYNVATTHPGDIGIQGIANFYSGNLFEVEVIPAMTAWGRPRVIHIVDRERFGQSRGKGALTSIVAQFKQVEQYLDAEMKNNLLNTIVAMIIETPVEDILDWFGGDPTKAMEQMASWKAPVLKGGMQTLRTKPGEKVTAHSPNRPGAQIQQFLHAFMHEMAAGSNTPFEQFSRDYSQSSYVGIRAGFVDAWRHYTGKREWLATTWNQRCYQLVMEEAANNGWIDAPDFYNNIRAYCGAEWIGAGQGYIDRVKEINGSILAVNNALSTHEIELAAQGRYWRDVYEQLAVERAERVRLGLPLDAATAVRETISNDAANNNDASNGDGAPAVAKPTQPTDKKKSQTTTAYQHQPLNVGQLAPEPSEQD